MKLRPRTISTVAMASTLALILSYIESLVPLSFAVPGIKMGLANIAIVFVLYRLGEKEAIAVSLIRLFWVAVLFGSFMTFLYSLAGAALSMTVMIILKRSGKFSAVGVSVAGGITHNAGQIIAAGIAYGDRSDSILPPCSGRIRNGHRSDYRNRLRPADKQDTQKSGITTELLHNKKLPEAG